jgi:MGT family glycosyltransferase
VNPTLGVAAELVDRGEDVVYVAAEQFRDAIEFTGARLKAYADPPPPDPTVLGPAALFAMLAASGREILPWLPEWLAAEKPDLVLADPMALWGPREADRQGIPVNGSYVSYLGTTLTSAVLANGDAKRMIGAITASAAFAEFTDVFGTQGTLPFESFQREDRTGISFMPRAFHPQGADIGDEVAFTGPAIRPRRYTGDFPLDRLEAGKTLFVSLGTVFNNQTEFFRSCFEAFADQPWTVVLAHGFRVDPAELGPAPANFLLAPSVPQLPVLERSQLFITHGGMNSTMEALWYGVPMVVVPQMPEQALTARRVTELGLGVDLDPSAITAAKLAAAVRTVDGTRSYHENVADMRKEVIHAGGASAAADILIARAASRT